MDEGLKDDKSVFLWAIPVLAQGGERQRMRGIVGEIKPALVGEAFVAGIGETVSAGSQQAIKLSLRPWLRFELVDLYEIVERFFTHSWRSFSEPKMKIFGKELTLLTNELLSDAFRCQSFGERNVGLTLRRNAFSTFCNAAKSSE